MKREIHDKRWTTTKKKVEGRLSPITSKSRPLNAHPRWQTGVSYRKYARVKPPWVCKGLWGEKSLQSIRVEPEPREVGGGAKHQSGKIARVE